ncbi:bumetanide-sensitive sodium-(potassium)-chloride cotransporter isoform X2 [Culicoides brevitarsis]|uniref:bumetanide-sensitive sodium-(potassium)-chloride cotransporter isoform X2 n=1 Tax=Culicoides brevitarsis TaxID=469753 RepID=UPI00307C4281
MSNGMELTNSMPRSASTNRFQVNPVNNKGATSNGDNNGTYVQHDETDDFDDNQLVKKASSIKVQPGGQIKSSIRDNSKQKRDTRTSFSVAPDEESDDSDNEEENLIDSDTKYGRSFRHFTREALPRLDNYRNILSIQAAYRPTLDELHNATLSNKGSTLHRDADVEGQVSEGMLKFGWFKGVMMRCLLNIWGVMLFLRLSWVVGQAGILQGCFLILTTSVVTTITALSMSAISTNGIIKGGGTYYMISRSLGPQFGAAIGLIFSLANAVACAMYVVGFCESMMDLLRSFGVSIVDGGIQDVRIIGSITIAILLLIVVVGMEWEAKAQLGLLVILLAAIADFMIGTIIGPKSDTDTAKGFLGYNWTLLKENSLPDYRTDKDGTMHDFFSVFAIFFPAATGILAGANISGDLKDPSHSIPRGTLWAILVTTVTYLIMAVQAGATVARDATGNVTLMINGSWDFLDCNNTKCDYGLQNSFQVIELVSAFGPIIYAGCFAATLSSALASLVSAPKVFQALCKDELYPKIKWFAKGYGKNNEPVRGYVLTFFIAVAFILIGELNAIAPLISNFFLAAYMLINFSTFHASLAKPVGWRPQFKYYNMWLSLAGSILCVAVMFLISWTTALLTFACVMSLYLIVAYRKPDVNWGSSTQAQTYKDALMSVQHLNTIEEHVKNYRPQILVLSGHTNSRPILVNFAFLLTKKTSLLVCGHVIKQVAPHKYRNFLVRKANDWFRRHKVKGFYTLVDDADFETGSKALMQATGVGKLKPNILLLGYKNDWISCDSGEREQYFNVLHKALDMHLAVAILRVSKGLDYSQVLGDEAPKHIMEAPRTLNANDSSADLMSHNKNSSAHGSCDSLSRNISGASSTSDLTFSGTPQTVNSIPDPTDIKRKLLDTSLTSKSKKVENDPSLLYRGPGGSELPKEVLNELTQFSQKRKTGLVDVYWLYDDGGLTLLLPYIISTRRNWSSCKLRVFALANKKDDLDFEQRSMAGLLAKFRIDYSHLKLLPDITKKPEDKTIKFFEDILKEFKDTNDETDENSLITQDELLALQDKTNRHLRLREYLLENSSKSDLVVMTLPMPRKNVVSAPLYMAWLETLSRGLPPFLFVRGNHQSVLTFYS